MEKGSQASRRESGRSVIGVNVTAAGRASRNVVPAESLVRRIVEGFLARYLRDLLSWPAVGRCVKLDNIVEFFDRAHRC